MTQSDTNDLWYPMVCKACGFKASSEHFIEMPTGGDDCEVLCPVPECRSSNTDEDYEA